MNNLTIQEIAAELGKKIKDDPIMVELNAAHTAYETDEYLQACLKEYEAQQNAIGLEAQKGESADRLLIAKLQGRVDELYKEILNSPVFARLSDAQQAVNELMENVNNIITFNLTGELPSSCTHDCSTCGGCGHH